MNFINNLNELPWQKVNFLQEKNLRLFHSVIAAIPKFSWSERAKWSAAQTHNHNTRSHISAYSDNTDNLYDNSAGKEVALEGKTHSTTGVPTTFRVAWI